MPKKIYKKLTRGVLFEIFKFIFMFLCSIGTYEIFKNSNYTFSIISLVFIIIYQIVLSILKSIDPYYRSIKKMNSKDKTHEKMRLYFDEVLPEKQKEVPKLIFKYVSLNSISTKDDNIQNESLNVENEKRFSSLIENKIWLSNTKNLNDPCEGQQYIYSTAYPAGSGIIDKNEAKFYCKKRSESFYKTFSYLKGYTYTTSFSFIYNSMPLWAHYSANHSGFCIAYEVINPSKLYKVNYSVGRIDLGSYLENLHDEFIMGELDHKQFLNILTNLNKCLYTIKSDDWQYECEVRAIMEKEYNDKPGYYLSCEELGLKINSIFIGLNCSKENEKRLILIAKELNVPVNKMIFDSIERRLIISPSYNKTL